MFRLCFITQHHQRHLIGRKFIPWHDNDPRHTVTVIKNYLQEQEEVLQQSLDLNIMESVQDYMKRQEQLRQPKSTKELWQVQCFLKDFFNSGGKGFLVPVWCVRATGIVRLYNLCFLNRLCGL